MITFKIDPKSLIKKLDKTLQKQAPKAIKKGLDRAAFDVRDDERKAMPRYLDRPKPFTLNGVAVKKANRTTLTAYVYVKPIQERYLIFQVQGGYTTKPHVVPARRWPRDPYGNLRRNATKGANVYESDLRGRRAYFKRRGNKGDYTLELIGFIPGSRTYRKLLPYFKIGRMSARANVRRKVSRELEKLGAVV